jgi:hypothetical protein
MAKEFLKQAYRAYIVTPERLNLLDTKIDNSAPTSLSQLRSWFAGVNSFYLEMLEQVEQTTASSTREIISQMATGINSNLPDQLRDLIKDLLKNMASKSSYALTIPWSNTRLAANAIRAAGTARGNPVTTEEITLYDESLKAIMLLRQQDKLNYALAAKFARSIS